MPRRGTQVESVYLCDLCAVVRNAKHGRDEKQFTRNTYRPRSARDSEMRRATSPSVSPRSRDFATP